MRDHPSLYRLFSLIKSEKMPPEFKDEFIKELMDLNIATEKLLAAVLIGICILLLAVDAYTTDLWRRDIHIFGRFGTLQILLLGTASVYLLLVKVMDKVRPSEMKYYRVLHFLLNIAVLNLCSLIAATNIVEGKQLFPYITAIFCISSLIFITSLERTPIFVTSYLSFLLGVLNSPGDLKQFTGDILFISFLILLALLVSRMKFVILNKRFLDKKTIARKNEENGRLLKEAMEYDELKNEFFTNISHEFRTPINVLLGTLQLINAQHQMEAGMDRTGKLIRYSNIMRQNCLRLLKLTNNLIDMTRLDSGFLEMSLHNHNIVQVVEDVTMSVADYIENKGVSLTFDTDVEEKVIAVDADMIERILLNLLSNAVKFTAEEGSIWVNVRDKDETVEISVKDTGFGIPPDKLDIIFERFRQVNSSLSRDNEGSGIGLSLVKSLVGLHGGLIRVESEPGKGTEFLIELPCAVIPDETVHEILEMDNKIDYKNHVNKVSVEFSDIPLD